jgi:curved DNA-binding protein
MTDGVQFIDYYRILQVRPDCDHRTLEAGYRFLAKRYHPDRLDTADIEKFNEVVEAYRVLRNPEQRAAYDELHAANVHCADYPFLAGKAESDERSAISDATAHAKILQYLYNLRRRNAQSAGIAAFYVKEMLNCSDEQFEFHQWYLKAKGFIETNEQGALAITVEGVDYIISMSRTSMAEKLLIAKANEAPS